MSRRQATSFFLIGGVTAQSTMWESWKNARMGRFTPWRETLGMPASSRAIQSGAALSTVTDALSIDGIMGEGKPEISPLVLLPYISPAPSLL